MSNTNMKMHNTKLDVQNKVVSINKHEGQFDYLGRWVDKHNFRAFVYNSKGEEKLANTYQEFAALISSGIWFDRKPIPTPKAATKDRKPKHDISSPDSK
jgi:hypothetical protein